MNSPVDAVTRTHGYAPINGLKMYYEIEGTGDPLVYIPPAFGFARLNSFSALARSLGYVAMTGPCSQGAQ